MQETINAKRSYSRRRPKIISRAMGRSCELAHWIAGRPKVKRLSPEAQPLDQPPTSINVGSWQIINMPYGHRVIKFVGFASLSQKAPRNASSERQHQCAKFCCRCGSYFLLRLSGVRIKVNRRGQSHKKHAFFLRRTTASQAGIKQGSAACRNRAQRFTQIYESKS